MSLAPTNPHITLQHPRVRLYHHAPFRYPISRWVALIPLISVNSTFISEQRRIEDPRAQTYLQTWHPVDGHKHRGNVDKAHHMWTSRWAGYFSHLRSQRTMRTQRVPYLYLGSGLRYSD